MFKISKLIAQRGLLFQSKVGTSQASSTREVIESYWQVEQKIDTLAEMLSKAKYPIVFTGAGISTSIGIPDYRSGQDTVIKTGPGLWNRDLNSPTNSPPKPHQTPIDKLVDVAHPSLSHMFISTLLRKNILKHLVSQNTDGLHVRSGVSLDKISELHGNRNLEHCLSCKRKYKRDFRTLRRDGKVYKPGQKRQHFTGRYCQNCGGELHDSIIYFGQKLPSDELGKAFYHAHQADLCICVGSSLTVKPSSLVPLQTLKKTPPGQLCIINIQQTPLDNVSQLKINYFCDEVFELLAKKMNIVIDTLVYRHYLQLERRNINEENVLVVEGKDKENDNLTFMKEVKLYCNGKQYRQEAKGHKCEIPLSEITSDLALEIHHFGDKKQMKFQLSPQELTTDRPLLVEYSKIEGGEWQLSRT